MRELIPQSTFFTQMVNRGILGHYVATASLATGVYETINNFASLPPEHPTVFEYFRKDLKRPASDAWVVAPSNGFNRIGESSHRSYGPGLGAKVILPKHLLTAATSGGGPDYEHLLRDNYETPFHTPEPAAPTGSAPTSGKPSRASPSMPAKPPCLFCRTSAATRMTIPAATDSSIIAPAMRSRALPG